MLDFPYVRGQHLGGYHIPEQLRIRIFYNGISKFQGLIYIVRKPTLNYVTTIEKLIENK